MGGVETGGLVAPRDGWTGRDGNDGACCLFAGFLHGERVCYGMAVTRAADPLEEFMAFLCMYETLCILCLILLMTNTRHRYMPS